MTAGESHLGERAIQEDAWLVARRPGALLCAVCDGMGGGASGRPAADLALETLRAHFVKGVDLERVVGALEEANRAIVARAGAARRRERGVDSAWQGSGTTAEIALFTRGRAQLAHVGDGRIYRSRAGRLEALTVEHTLRNDYRRLAPEMPLEAVENIPHNILTRALGMADEILIDRLEVDAVPGDLFVVCSDGLTALLDDGAIAEVLARNPGPGDAVRALIDAALAVPKPAGSWGHKDNITVVVHAVGGRPSASEQGG